LIQRIVEAVHPLKIIVFGSAARGDSKPASDIDLLVVMPEGVHRRRVAQDLYRRIRGIGVPFDLLVATPSDLEKHKDNIGLIYRTVLLEGKEVYVAS
jgi:predicted nucleotidyltransferase